MGYRNERVAQDSYHRFRAKLRGDKNYGNARGRAQERLQKKLRELDVPSTPAGSIEDDGEDADWAFGGGGEGGSSSIGFVVGFIGEGEVSRQGRSITVGRVTPPKDKGKETTVKAEIKEEKWVWEGEDVSWMDVPVNK
jgi:hypothetical protein